MDIFYLQITNEENYVQEDKAPVHTAGIESCVQEDSHGLRPEAALGDCRDRQPWQQQWGQQHHDLVPRGLRQEEW